MHELDVTLALQTKNKDMLNINVYFFLNKFYDLVLHIKSIKT